MNTRSRQVLIVMAEPPGGSVQMNRLLREADLISLHPMWRIRSSLLFLLAVAKLSRGEDRFLKEEVASRIPHGSRMFRI
jgi:hypothetical protein